MAPSLCRSNYYADTGQTQHRGDREVRCGLPAGHDGASHVELDDDGAEANSWLRPLFTQAEMIPTQAAEVAALRQQLDEARDLRDGLSDRDLLTDVPSDRLVAEVLALIDRGYQQYTELRSLYVDLLAANARLLDVYRAAEAWATSWARTADGVSFDPRTHDALINAVDSYRPAAPAEPAPGADWKPEPGEVAYRLEAWPHNAGEHGEWYSSGCQPAADVVREVRSLADHIESYWPGGVPVDTEEAERGN